MAEENKNNNTEQAQEEIKETEGGARYRLPYGIARGLGINTDGLTPREVWDILKGHGIVPKKEYEKLKEEKQKKEKEPVKVENKEVEHYNERQREKIKNFRNDYYQKKHEFGLVLDENGDTFVFREGKSGSVGFFPNEYKNFKGKSIVHNHPQGNTFLSLADIEMFMSSGLRTIEADGYDGWIHTVELLPQDNPETQYGLEKRVVDFYREYGRALQTGRIKARKEWDKSQKKQVKSGQYLIKVPETWSLYRNGASPRDMANYVEFTKIIQDELMEFSKTAEQKYGIRSVFKKEK